MQGVLQRLSARFSAEDSLPRPTSQPDPPVYLAAGEHLGIEGQHGRIAELRRVGVAEVVSSWAELEQLLGIARARDNQGAVEHTMDDPRKEAR